MPPKTEAPTMTVLATDEECVVEIFADWCGPSEAVLSTILNNHRKFSNKKIKWYQANSKEIKELAKYSADAKPRFLFYRDGEVMEAIEGVNAPSISRCIDEYCPEGMVETVEVAEEAGDEEDD